MLFNSWIYILFLLTTVILFWKLPQRFRIPLVLVASYVFYMSWSPPFGLIYGPLIFLDSMFFYYLSVAMVKWPQYKKKILIAGVTSELLVLAYFKYANFILESLAPLFKAFGGPEVQHLDIFLPLAISFTNFILISYLVDVYRGNEKPDPSPVRFAAYVAFFPHLIAGPIVRASELLHQFDKNVHFDWDNVVKGVYKFMAGLGLKLFIADAVAAYVNAVFGNQEIHAFDTSWVATYGFAIQIFCDFYSYTLMAQGSALLMGYTLPENFDSPYLSKNITDFWRRWHMSLSRWLKDYLYIPLGGSRCSRVKAYRNLFITMGLGGLWHGASWNFVIWGLYQGLLLSLHKFAMHFKINRLVPAPVAVFITFHLVCIGWVFFRAKSFLEAISMLQAMFSPPVFAGLNFQAGVSIVTIVLFLIVHWVMHYYSDKQLRPAFVTAVQSVACFFFFYMIITYKTTPQQFIYFQF